MIIIWIIIIFFRNHKAIATVWEKHGYEITHHFEFEPPMIPPPVISSSQPPMDPPVVNRRPALVYTNATTSQHLKSNTGNPIDLTAEAASIAGIVNPPPTQRPSQSANILKPQQNGQLNMRTNVGSKRPSVRKLFPFDYQFLL